VESRAGLGNVLICLRGLTSSFACATICVMELHDRIRRARHKKGMTQEQVARKANLPLRSYVNWELGHHQPKANALAAIAAATEQDVGFFFASDEEDEEEASANAEQDFMNALTRLLSSTREGTSAKRLLDTA
jgi:transcriptional regulator with XRE-family HTH domain